MNLKDAVSDGFEMTSTADELALETLWIMRRFPGRLDGCNTPSPCFRSLKSATSSQA